jgi:preprotein translocase subunit SecD
MEMAQTSWIDWFVSFFGAIFSFMAVSLGGSGPIAGAPMVPTYEIVLKTTPAAVHDANAILIDRLGLSGATILFNDPKLDGEIQFRIQTSIAPEKLTSLLTAQGKVEIAEALDADEEKIFGRALRTLPMPDGSSIGVRAPVLEGQIFASVSSDFDEATGAPVVKFRMTPRARDIFAKLTTEKIGKTFAIIVDDRVISAPHIMSPILEGYGTITGNFTIEETQGVAALMNTNTLPAPVTLERIDTVAR